MRPVGNVRTRISTIGLPTFAGVRATVMMHQDLTGPDCVVAVFGRHFKLSMPLVTHVVNECGYNTNRSHDLNIDVVMRTLKWCTCLDWNAMFPRVSNFRYGLCGNFAK